MIILPLCGAICGMNFILFINSRCDWSSILSASEYDWLKRKDTKFDSVAVNSGHLKYLSAYHSRNPLNYG